jgi:hypothetical protein
VCGRSGIVRHHVETESVVTKPERLVGDFHCNRLDGIHICCARFVDHRSRCGSCRAWWSLLPPAAPATLPAPRCRPRSRRHRLLSVESPLACACRWPWLSPWSPRALQESRRPWRTNAALCELLPGRRCASRLHCTASATTISYRLEIVLRRSSQPHSAAASLVDTTTFDNLRARRGSFQF